MIDAGIRAAFQEERERTPANHLTRLPARPASEAPIEKLWVSIKTAAAMSSYNERTIRRNLANGSLKGSGLRGGRIARFELQRWMDEMATRGQPVDAGGDEDADVNEAVDRMLSDDK